MLRLDTDQNFNNFVLLATCSLPGEWGGQVHYLPLH
jgi:hypothetical protein